jgi:hypothetical protein
LKTKQLSRTTRGQKAKVAKGLAFASALTLLLTFVFREILKDNLKELHDSHAFAQAQFRNENDQSTNYPDANSDRTGTD